MSLTSRAAFASLYRVLRPGGRISLFEPINRLMFPEPDGRFFGYDLSSVGELVARVHAIFRVGEPAVRSAMIDFDDRDLAKLAEEAGFDPVHVECHIDIECGGGDLPISLEALLDGAPNPNTPTVREAVHAALTGPEQVQFMTALTEAFKTAGSSGAWRWPTYRPRRALRSAPAIALRTRRRRLDRSRTHARHRHMPRGR